MSLLLTVCQLGRMGDIVAMEPAYRHLRNLYPDRTFRFYTKEHYLELLAFNPYIDEVVTVNDAMEYLELKAALPWETISYEFNFHDPRIPHNCRHKHSQKTGIYFPSLLEQFSRSAGLQAPDDTPEFHFNPQVCAPPLPDRYAVFHCASRGKSRQWPEKYWCKLAEQFFEAGYTVVEIGMEPVLQLKHPLYIDMSGKISLQIAARIIAGAKVFVGVESGFGHIANATGVFGIIITGKLRQYPDYVTYSGRFRRGEGCNLVRFYNMPAYRVPLKTVQEIAAHFIAGTPMSKAECDRFCMIEQIKTLQHSAIQMLLEPFYGFRNTLAVCWHKHYGG